MILPCSCHSPNQDKVHGVGNRVFNKCKPKLPGHWYRCIVCGREREVGKEVASEH